MIVYLAIMAVLCRATIPAGYMPGLSAHQPGKVALAFCSGSGAVASVFLEVPGKSADSSPEPAGPDCPFGAFAKQGAIPEFPPEVRPALLTSIAVDAPVVRQALPPLPPLGPPLGSRAPPSHLA